MALGPKELGSWANESTLSTEFGEDPWGNQGRVGTSYRSSVFSSGSANVRTSGSSSLPFRVSSGAPMTDRASGGWGRRWRRSRFGWSGGSFGLRSRSVLLQVVKNVHVVVAGIKLGSECAPDAFFECDIDLP